MGPTYFMSGTHLAGLLSWVVQIWFLFCSRIKKKNQMARKISEMACNYIKGAWAIGSFCGPHYINKSM